MKSPRRVSPHLHLQLIFLRLTVKIPIVEKDWNLSGCQVQPGGEVFVNSVGTHGVASTRYFWPRVGSAIGRLCQYISGTPARTWHLLVTEDYHLDAGGPRYRESIIVFFVLCSVLGVPLSWRKTSGGDTVSWVGFELLHRSYKIGLSERRSQWFQKRNQRGRRFRLRACVKFRRRPRPCDVRSQGTRI